MSNVTYPTTTPETLPNGAIVVAHKPRAVGHARIVLAFREGSVQPFVTWECASFDRSCHFGHYFSNLADAMADFDKRP